MKHILSSVLLMLLHFLSPFVAEHWVPVCQGSNGEILLSSKNTSVVTIKEVPIWTTFATEIKEYDFKCLSSSNDNYFPSITFKELDPKQGDNKTPRRDKIQQNTPRRETTRTLDINRLKSRNAFNKGNITLSCDDLNGNICTATFIVVMRTLRQECKFNNTLSCDIKDVNKETSYKQKLDTPNVKYRNQDIKVSSDISATTVESRIFKYPAKGRTINAPKFIPQPRFKGPLQENATPTLSSPKTILTINQSSTLEAPQIVKYSIFNNQKVISKNYHSKIFRLTGILILVSNKIMI